MTKAEHATRAAQLAALIIDPAKPLTPEQHAIIQDAIATAIKTHRRLSKVGHEKGCTPARPRLPDELVTPQAIYMREYRKQQAKKSA